MYGCMAVWHSEYVNSIKETLKLKISETRISVFHKQKSRKICATFYFKNLPEAKILYFHMIFNKKRRFNYLNIEH